MPVPPSENLSQLRVDLVGSFLRPARLKAVFARYVQGQAEEPELRQAQDEAIQELVAAQEAHGLPVQTDGEFRRFHFMESFADVAGMGSWRSGWRNIIRALEEQSEASEKRPERGLNPVLRLRRPVTERIRLLRNRPLEEFQYAQGLTRRPVKITLINADRILEGHDAEGSRSVYAHEDEFLADVVAIQRQIVSELVQAGCRYIQLDGPSYTRYVDPSSVEDMRSRGEDPKANMERAIRSDNAVMEGFDNVTFGIHTCRGNRRGYWHREGFYDSIAEQLFHNLKHQRLLLEYDTERAGNFAPLRFVPKNKTAVLGLISTKTGQLETVDTLKRRIEEAARYVPIEQIALSPQCGFASDLAGNPLRIDDQWRKLDAMMETARQVWG